MPKKYFVLLSWKNIRMEEVLCSAQEHDFKEIIVSLIRSNYNIVILYESIPNFLNYGFVNNITPGISFKILR